ncbi:MAG TPA: SDR family oxidoreductase [Gammaproteobacteria bacterium]|nr:SDR family oxidoreductase [Gammaproteobacteria bacterium]
MLDEMFAVDREIVVVTGVAGQLGLQYARAFLSRGARVVGLDLNISTSLEGLQDQFGDKFYFSECDVTDAVRLRTVAEDVLRKFGAVTVLINNAAIDSPPGEARAETGPFEDYPDSSWDEVLEVNLKGTYLACKVFGAQMAKNNGGSIINVSSIYGVVSPDQSIYEYRRRAGEVFFKPVAYAVSKSGVLNLTRYLAVYWAKSNVRVNTLVIGGVFNDQDKEFLGAYCQRIPIGRMAKEDEYNGALIFLASRASQYMTGAQLVIDGGWTAI